MKRIRAFSWRGLWRKAVQIARLFCGVPDYETYVAHRQAHHAQESILSYEAFFNERQKARYKKGQSRCC